MLQCVAGCILWVGSSVMQIFLYSQVCCSVLQGIAGCCSVYIVGGIQCDVSLSLFPDVLQCVAMCCRVLQGVASCGGVLQCISV